MANAAEKMFDRVLPAIGENGRDDTADWPGFPQDETDTDPIDNPPRSSIEDFYPREYGLSSGPFFDGSPEDERDRRISPEERDLCEGGIRIRGMEALAFYKSKRFEAQEPYRGYWGIFYLDQGLLFLSGEILKTYPGHKNPDRLAKEFLFAHEHYHFRADLQTLMLEAVQNRHLYLPLRRALRGRKSHFVEEALANREAFEWSNRSANGIREFAYDFMSLQPNAYARFDEHVIDLQGEWLANTLDLQPPGCFPRLDAASWVNAIPKDFLRRSLCPQYVIHPRRLADWLDPAWIPPPVLSVVEGDEVKKRLSNKYRNLTQKWENTKRKLIGNRTLRGLNFKPWPKDGKGSYSVKLDDGFRAHLRHQGNGTWVAYILGSHKELGHG